MLLKGKEKLLDEFFNSLCYQEVNQPCFEPCPKLIRYILQTRGLLDSICHIHTTVLMLYMRFYIWTQFWKTEKVMINI